MLEAARQLVALAEDASQHAPVETLTNHEYRTLKPFAEGNNSPSIARKLGISAQTLRNRLHRINRKLRTHSRLEAVTHAQQRELIE
jgi:DNA-binding NarL/FixJ family response regulator